VADDQIKAKGAVKKVMDQKSMGTAQRWGRFDHTKPDRLPVEPAFSCFGPGKGIGGKGAARSVPRRTAWWPPGSWRACLRFVL